MLQLAGDTLPEAVRGNPLNYSPSKPSTTAPLIQAARRRQRPDLPEVLGAGHRPRITGRSEPLLPAVVSAGACPTARFYTAPLQVWTWEGKGHSRTS